MCRFLFTMGKIPASRIQQLLVEAQMPYIHKCLHTDLSYGCAGWDPKRKRIIGYKQAYLPICEGKKPKPLSTPYAMYHVRLKKGPGSNVAENAHPFVKQDRYIFMLNGRIPAMDSGENKTDGEAFMELWLRLKGSQSLAESLHRPLEAVSHIPSLINCVMMDTHTGEIVIYRHKNKGFSTGIWYDPSFKIVTNFQMPGFIELPRGSVLVSL